jgi:hypothetical protein
MTRAPNDGRTNGPAWRVALDARSPAYFTELRFARSAPPIWRVLAEPSRSLMMAGNLA